MFLVAVCVNILRAPVVDTSVLDSSFRILIAMLHKDETNLATGTKRTPYDSACRASVPTRRQYTSPQHENQCECYCIQPTCRILQ
jgi:hypothetical protein